MASIIIPILRRTDLVFTAVGSTPIEQPTVKLINALNFTQGLVVARVHAKSNSSSSTQTFNVVIKNVAPSDEDPSVDFVGTAIATASFTISGGTTGAMTPVFMPLTTPISPWLRAMISASQTVQNTLFTLTASADLILRTDAG
jgi:hypothetical protein